MPSTGISIASVRKPSKGISMSCAIAGVTANVDARSAASPRPESRQPFIKNLTRLPRQKYHRAGCAQDSTPCPQTAAMGSVPGVYGSRHPPHRALEPPSAGPGWSRSVAAVSWRRGHRRSEAPDSRRGRGWRQRRIPTTIGSKTALDPRCYAPTAPETTRPAEGDVNLACATNARPHTQDGVPNNDEMLRLRKGRTSG